MKIEIDKQKPEFAPVRLTLVLESQAELDFWGTLFNHSHLDDLCIEITGCGLDYELLETAGANINMSSILNRLIVRKSS